MTRHRSLVPLLVKLFAKRAKPKKSPKGASGRKKGPGGRFGKIRLATIICTIAIPAVFCIWGAFVMRSGAENIAAMRERLPGFIFSPLEYFGNRTLFTTDAIGLTGHDAVYSYDSPAPAGEVFFAGAPVRTGNPAPDDIRMLDRGDFVVGWSNSLRHPAWVSYHVPRNAKFPVGERPPFKHDKAVWRSPYPEEYTNSKFDRGHMAPNHAIASRFGADAQKKTFLMSNIAPQTPELNRGIWREIELSVADVWADIYGEIWVTIGSIPSPEAERQAIAGSIDIPAAYYMIIVAETETAAQAGGNEEPYEIRAMAMVFPQEIAESGVFAMHYLTSIDEIEKATGLDFLSDLPDFIEDPLEADRATRTWPVGWMKFLSLVGVTGE